MNKKKIVLGIATLAVAVAIVPLFAAFEAHVINVTAKIENALGVSTDSIDFGTVFPQEELDKPLTIQLSKSFLDEQRVDDVDYIIRQKPKCGWTLKEGTNLLGLPTATGHVYEGKINGEQYATQFDDYYVVCPDPGNPLRPAGSVYGVLPSLCEYISKTDDKTPDNDGELASFHKPWTVGDSIDWNDTLGRLSKVEGDTVDNWTIDLAVPCFGGHCAQDWDAFVTGINPTASSTDYIQPIGNEHKIFGCDLWVEVTGVSETPSPTPSPTPTPLPQCSDTQDNDGDALIDIGDPGCHDDYDLGGAYNANDNDETNSTSSPIPTP